MICKESVILIPARLKSTRLKEKLLLKIGNKSIINHTYLNACKSKISSKVIILVDSEKLYKHCLNFTDNVIITSSDHKNGTERIIEFLKTNISYKYIINVQADEPFINYKLIDNLFEKLKNKNPIVTAFYEEICPTKNDTNKVKVVCNHDAEAIFFSRNSIPFFRNKNFDEKIKIHIGIYGYHRNELITISRLKESYLEKIEMLEQLRLIENNKKIKLVKTDSKNIGIDTYEDYLKAKKKYEED